MTYAVIAVNGKQYLVEPGTKLRLDKVEGSVGGPVEFPAMLRFTPDGIELGRPTLTAPVLGKITARGRLPKLTVIKFKRKVRYRRKVGHRQHFTAVEITQV